MAIINGIGESFKRLVISLKVISIEIFISNLFIILRISEAKKDLITFFNFINLYIIIFPVI